MKEAQPTRTDVEIVTQVATDQIVILDKALSQEREMVKFYKDREEHFAKVLGVADGGKYRADWDVKLTGLIAELEQVRQERDAWRHETTLWAKKLEAAESREKRVREALVRAKITYANAEDMNIGQAFIKRRALEGE